MSTPRMTRPHPDSRFRNFIASHYARLVADLPRIESEVG